MISSSLACPVSQDFLCRKEDLDAAVLKAVGQQEHPVIICDLVWVWLSGQSFQLQQKNKLPILECFDFRGNSLRPTRRLSKMLQGRHDTLNDNDSPY